MDHKPRPGGPQETTMGTMNMNNNTGYIFDLDGTLSNTLESLSVSGNLALKEIGMEPFEMDRYRYFVGDGADELVRRMLIADGDTKCEYYDELRSAYRRTFAEHADYKVTVYEGMPETLRELKKRGHKLAVLSNKPHKQAIEVVHKLYGEDIFDHIQGNVRDIPRKPSPEGALLTAGMIGLDPARIIYVGDTSTDMQTGNNAGMFTVGVLWGFRDRKELEDNNAKLIIQHPNELLSVVIPTDQI